MEAATKKAYSGKVRLELAASNKHNVVNHRASFEVPILWMNLTFFNNVGQRKAKFH